MNSDTFASLMGGSGRNFLTAVTGIGTAETLVTVGSDSGAQVTANIGVGSQAAVVGSNTPLDPNVPAAMTMDQLGRAGLYRSQNRPYFQSGSFDGRGFRVRFQGKFTTSAVDSVTGHAINLYWGSTITAANKLAAGLTGATLAAGNYNFIIEVTALWDSVSQTLIGEFWSNVAGTYTSRTALTNTASPTVYTALTFSASYKFNTGAANTITPVEFSMEQI